MDDLEMVKKWLRSKQVTLWADWDLTHEDRLQLAAEWFLRERRAFLDYYSWTDVSNESFDVV